MTYVRIKHHDKVASKIITLIRGSGGDIQKWNLKVRRLAKRIKNKAAQESDYLDLDQILGMIMEEYKNQRNLLRKDFERQFTRVHPKDKGNLELDAFLEILQGGMHAEPPKGSKYDENPFLKWPGEMSRIRAYVFAVMSSDKNNNEITGKAFIAACSRFAIESPTPTVAWKLALYGNNKSIMEQLQEIEHKKGRDLPDGGSTGIIVTTDASVLLDTRQHASHTMGLRPKKASDRPNLKLALKLSSDDLPTTAQVDPEEALFMERKPEKEVRELVVDREILTSNQVPAGMVSQKQEYVMNQQAQNPANSGKNPPNLLLGGVKLKIQAIKQKHDQVTKLTRLQLRGLGEGDFGGFDYVKDDSDPSKQKVIDLMDNKRQILTDVKTGVSKKQIIVPSFETTTRIFNTHIMVLQELQYNIQRLKQAYYAQMDKRKTWEQVDSIIKVLDIGCQYLDFPKGGVEANDSIENDNEKDNSALLPSHA